MQIIKVGGAVLTVIAEMTAGLPSPPFKIDNQWFVLTEVPPPTL